LDGVWLGKDPPDVIQYKQDVSLQEHGLLIDQELDADTRKLLPKKYKNASNLKPYETWHFHDDVMCMIGE
jgi:hypothetical protein